MRRAFTLMEVLVAVVIIALAMLFVLQMHSRAQNEAMYIQKRALSALQSSLFLTEKTKEMHKKKIDAYSLWQGHLTFRKDRSIALLKKTERTVTSRKEVLTLGDEKSTFTFESIETYMTHRYSDRFYRIGM